MVDIDELISAQTLTHLDPASALDVLAELFDTAHDLRREDGLRKGIKLGSDLLTGGLSAEQEALLHYFVGNGWASLRYLRRHADESATWKWEQPEAREQILAFRRAHLHPGFLQLPAMRRCQIATNLGNLMSSLGRFVEAIDYYNAALSIQPDFGMALANKGDCLLHYARAQYDDGHQAVFARECEGLIDRALRLPLEPGVERGLRSAREYALQRAGKSVAEWDRERGEGLGDGDEAVYRSWALENRLFLNPLNDLGPYSIAANDILHLPTMRVDLSIGSGFHGFFNQLKQEFVVARHLCFEGIRQAAPHYADLRTALLDTWNGTAFGLSLERVKLAFRSAYSLLDKASVLLARYFAVPVPLHKVTIRSIWHSGKPGEGPLRKEFENRENWPLRGLFWLSKDFHEWDSEYHAAIEPDARETAKLRNQLEHQYARIVEAGSTPAVSQPALVPPDPFAYAVDRLEFEAKTLKSLRTARAALIYLSLALHAEERHQKDVPNHLVHQGSFPVLNR